MNDMPLLLPPRTRAPRPRPGAVDRPLLERRLDGALDVGLGLVCARAGYGKTTLLASWAAGLGRRADIAWLSLLPECADSAVFAQHLGSALHPSLPLPSGGGLGETLAALARAASHRGRPIVLVLDDLDRVGNQKVMDSLAWLLDRRPAKLLVVVGAREEPQLPWHRFRAHGELIELRSRDLAFSASEARALLRGRFGVRLPDQRMDDLCRVTEGWVGGLCLAGLAMQGVDDPGEILAGRPERHSYVRDYLEHEAVRALPGDVVTFLERTSVLERLDPPLCDLLTGRGDSLEVLRWLVARNVFTEEISDEPPAFRYHALLMTHMRARLSAHSPDDVRRLLAMASTWYEERGIDDDAIETALRGGDVVRAERLIRPALGRAMRGGFVWTAAHWLRQMPADVLSSSPDLLLALGRASGLEGDLVTTKAAVTAVANALAAEGASADPALRIELDQLKASLGVWAGAVSSIRPPLDEALATLDRHAGDPGLELLTASRESLLALLGEGLVLNGQWSEALEVVDDQLLPEAVLQPTRDTVLALGSRALALAWSGRESEAREALRQSSDVVHRFSGVGPHAFALHVAAAWVADGSDAEAGLDAASAVAMRTDIPITRAIAKLATAHLYLRRGHPDLAARALAAAEDVIAAMPDPGVLATLRDHLRADLDLIDPSDEVPNLTTHELAALEAVARGATRRQAARRLHVSVDTVKTHLRTAYRKLGASDREEAVAKARAFGLIPGE